MNVIVGPSLCFGFNFKVDLKAEEIININHLDEPVADEPVIDESIADESVIIKSKSYNIIDSLKKVESEQDKINILEKAVNDNTLGLTVEKKNEYIKYLIIFINKVDDPKLKQLLEDLYVK